MNLTKWFVVLMLLTTANSTFAEQPSEKYVLLPKTGDNVSAAEKTCAEQSGTFVAVPWSSQDKHKPYACMFGSKALFEVQINIDNKITTTLKLSKTNVKTLVETITKQLGVVPNYVEKSMFYRWDVGTRRTTLTVTPDGTLIETELVK